MKTVRWSIIIGIIIFILTVLSQLPAKLVLTYVPTHMPLKLQNVTGSLWSGSAGYVSYNNIQLGRLDWKLKPLHLFTGRVAVYAELKGEALSFLGNVAIDFEQKIYLQDSSMHMDSLWIERFQPLPVKVSGLFWGVINHADWDLRNTQKIPLIHGVINWKEGQTITPFKVPPGNYQAKLSPTEDIQNIQLSSEKAPIDLSGHIDLKADGSYHADLHFKATELANNNIHNMLALLGKPDAEGNRYFRQSGHLQQFFR